MMCAHVCGIESNVWNVERVEALVRTNLRPLRDLRILVCHSNVQASTTGP